MEWIEANGVSLRYTLSGKGTEVVVLVHEIGGAIESWDESMVEFEKEFQVLRYDQRGFGLSEKSSDITIESSVADLLGLLDALSISQACHLVAPAMGAAIAIAFAARYPTRVKRLVVSSPVCDGVPVAALPALEARISAVETKGLRAVIDTSLTKSYAEHLRNDKARFDRYRLRWMGNDPESFAAISRLVVQTHLNSDLSRIACPTLFIGCTYDPIRPPIQTEQIAKSVANSSYVEVASGHFLPVQAPDLFAATVIPFLLDVGRD